MVVDDIIRIAKRLCDDDQSIQTSDLTDWIDMGIDELNKNLSIQIPHIAGLPTNSTSPNFDSRYHNILVDYCIIKYREGDSDYNASGYFLKVFNDKLQQMERDMPKNPSIRTDYDVMQLTPPDTTGVIPTNQLPYGAYFDNIRIYQNDVDITSYCTLDSVAMTLTIDITQLTVAITDKITIVFDNNAEMENPPYSWWANSGW